MIDKFPEDLRTFETRLQFLNDIFLNLYSPQEIMANCIQHKLDRSYLSYVETLDVSLATLVGKDTLKILKNIDY